MKGTKFLFAAGLSALSMGFCACGSEDGLLGDGASVVEPAVPEVPSCVYSVTIVDGNGVEVTNFDKEFVTYYAKVEAQGDWTLDCDEDFVTLRAKSGNGNALIPFYVSNNWYDTRSFNIYASAVNGVGTRAGSSTTVAAGTQSGSALGLDDVKKRITSNLGAGYSLKPREDGNLALCTGIQLFNMGKLDALGKEMNVSLVTDEVYDKIEQYVLSSTSNSDLHKGVTVGAQASLKVGGLTGTGDIGVGVGTTEKTGKIYAVKRMLREMYSREVDYANIVVMDKAGDAKLDLLAPGFRMVRDKLSENLVKAIGGEKKDSATADKLCAQFIDEFGFSFVTKSLMGCSFDYYIAVDSSLVDDEVAVSAVLDAKYSKVVTDTVKNGKKETLVKDTTSISGDVDVAYQNKLTKASNSTEAQVVIYGGDTKAVDILATGGSLDLQEVSKWRGTVTPANVVMVDLKSELISSLFTDDVAKGYLYDYIKRVATTNSIKKE